jgi:hypothetical protein
MGHLDDEPAEPAAEDGLPSRRRTGEGPGFRAGRPDRLHGQGGTEIGKLSDPSGAALRERLRTVALVEIRTADGQWTRDIHLPAGEGLDGKVVRVIAGAGYGSTIHYGERTVGIGRGQTQTFHAPVAAGSATANWRITRWPMPGTPGSAVLPAEWCSPA